MIATRDEDAALLIDALSRATEDVAFAPDAPRCIFVAARPDDEAPRANALRVERDALLAAPAEQLRRICDFAGLTYDQALLTPIEAARRGGRRHRVAGERLDASFGQLSRQPDLAARLDLPDEQAGLRAHARRRRRPQHAFPRHRQADGARGRARPRRAGHAHRSAYSDKGTGDVTLTKKQAKAACARLVKDGLKATIKTSGKGHAKPIASNKTQEGPRPQPAHRRDVHAVGDTDVRPKRNCFGSDAEGRLRACFDSAWSSLPC